jgi:hypothetical protein
METNITNRLSRPVIIVRLCEILRLTVRYGCKLVSSLIEYSGNENS